MDFFENSLNCPRWQLPVSGSTVDSARTRAGRAVDCLRRFSNVLSISRPPSEKFAVRYTLAHLIGFELTIWQPVSGKLRDKSLDRDTLYTLLGVDVLTEQHRRTYNRVKPLLATSGGWTLRVPLGQRGNAVFWPRIGLQDLKAGSSQVGL